MRCKMKQLLKIMFLCTCCFILVACHIDETPSKKIGSFSFTNQNGEPFGTDQLSGQVWIANFIFTDCETICIPMSAEMAILQETLKKEELPVQLVSFSVDPEIDTPEILHHYMQDFTDDSSNWNFLTGYTQKDIEQFALKQFNTMVQKPSTSTQVIHSSDFYVIDGAGQLISEYNYVQPAYEDKLIQAIKKELH